MVYTNHSNRCSKLKMEFVRVQTYGGGWAKLFYFSPIEGQEQSITVIVPQVR